MRFSKAMWHFGKLGIGTAICVIRFWSRAAEDPPREWIEPVVEKGARSRRVYLPEGAWHDWWTGKKVEGKRWIERPVDLATLPLYARGGAIVPLDPVRQYTSQPVTEPTTLRVYPGTNGAFTLYDDDGHSLGYRDGSDPKMIWIRFRWDDANRRLTLEPDERMKQWPGGVRVFSVEVVGSDARPKRVEFRGERVRVDLRMAFSQTVEINHVAWAIALFSVAYFGQQSWSTLVMILPRTSFRRT